MSRSTAAAFAALLLIAPAAAQAQTPPPRDTVAAVAGQIRERYFDPARAEAIAAALEAEATAGAFDALTDPHDLAGALTRRLRPEDGHFSVAYAPAPAAAQPAGGGDFDEDSLRRENYGWREVAVLPGNIGYVDLRFFGHIEFDDPADPVRRAADAALSFLSQADAVIIDVRHNGGGAPSMVGYLASAFTRPGADIYNVFHSREGTESEAPAQHHPAPRLDAPLYILTSRRTGSAAEALPYTLQAAGRATVVGQRTAGAANPGGPAPVPGGFRVFVADGSPRNPITGGNWEGDGVQPDVAVPADQALARAQVLALEAILARADNPAARAEAQWVLEAMTAAPPAMRLEDYAGDYGGLTISVDASGLSARRGERPALRLAPLRADLFYAVDDPTQRMAFERDAAGRVVALEQRAAGGRVSRSRRDG